MSILIALVVLFALTILCIAGRIKSGTWVEKFLLGIDVLLCTLIWGGFGITISARCGLYLRRSTGPWIWRALGKGLNAISAGHCEFAIASDQARAEQVLVLLGKRAAGESK